MRANLSLFPVQKAPINQDVEEGDVQVETAAVQTKSIPDKYSAAELAEVGMKRKQSPLGPLERTRRVKSKAIMKLTPEERLTEEVACIAKIMQMRYSSAFEAYTSIQHESLLNLAINLIHLHLRDKSHADLEIIQHAQFTKLLWLIAYVLNSEQLKLSFVDSKPRPDFEEYLKVCSSLLDDEQKEMAETLFIGGAQDLRVTQAFFLQNVTRFFEKFSLKAEVDEQKQLLNLYPAQQACIQAFRDKLKENAKHPHGYFHMPTGTGKTETYLIISFAVNMPTLIVVPTVALAEQTMQRVLATAKKLNLDRDVKIFSGTIKEEGEDITIITYQSFLQQVRIPGQYALLDVANYPLIILDEAHHALTENLHPYIRDLMNRQVVYGFSATRKLSRNKQRHDLADLSELFDYVDEDGQERSGLINFYDLGAAIKEGYLSPCYNILIQTSHALLPKRNKKGNELKLFSKESLEQLDKSELNEIAVDFYCNQYDPVFHRPFLQQPTIVNCATIAQAENVAAAFNARFDEAYICAKAKAVSSINTRNECLSILEGFRDGEFEVLCGADLLVEGVDCPRVSLVINIAPTFSERKEQQRCGRGLRLSPGKSLSYIVDFYWTPHQVLFQHILKSPFMSSNTVSLSPITQAPTKVSANGGTAAHTIYWDGIIPQEGAVKSQTDEPSVCQKQEMIEYTAPQCLSLTSESSAEQFYKENLPQLLFSSVQRNRLKHTSCEDSFVPFQAACINGV